MNPLSKFLEWRRRRMAVRDLRALPPELLLDIGIEPDQVGAVALAAFNNRGARMPSRFDAPAFATPGLSNSAWPYPSRQSR